MLRKLKPEEFDACAQAAYEAAQKLSQSSFPVYADGVKTKEDFMSRARKAFGRENEEILLSEECGVVRGWIHFYAQKEERYLGVCTLIAWNGYRETLEGLLAYWRERYAGYAFGIYFPEENREARICMEQNGFLEQEQSVVDVLHFKDYVPKCGDARVRLVDEKNYALFGTLHDAVCGEMYWTSGRILADLQNWAIYAYVENGVCLGTLYHNGKGGKNLEIFGIDAKDGVFRPEVTRALLVACLNRAKEDGAESMYFFNDDDTHGIAEELGFSHITTACYFGGTLLFP